jgi:hypothetical protein
LGTARLLGLLLRCDRFETRLPCTFKQRDLARAIRAIAAAGVEGRVEIGRDDKMLVVICKAAGSTAVERNEWDEGLNGADQA